MWRRLAYIAMETYWRTAKPRTLGARVLAWRDDSILLVRHTYVGGWFFPGGGIKRGESARAAAQRELAEECGFAAQTLDFGRPYFNNAFGKNDHIMFFQARDLEPISTHTNDGEIAECRFFPVQDLPEAITPATARRVAEVRGETAVAEIW